MTSRDALTRADERRQRLRRPARQRRLAVGLRHRLRGPARRRRHHRPRRASTRPTLAAYCLMLGDDALVTVAPALASGAATRRTSRTTSRWPTSRSTCSARPGCCWPAPRPPTRRVVPALPEGSPVPAEDALAFFRDAGDFRNVRLVEVAERRLRAHHGRGCCCSRRGGSRCSSGWPRSRDPVLAAIAAKGVKELTYHRDYAGRWFLTLAQGTDESRRRLLAGLDRVWPLLRRAVRRPRGRGRPRRASASTRRRSRRGRRRARAGLRASRRRPTDRPAGRRRGGPARRPHTEALSPDARRDAGRRPGPPDGAVVTGMTTADRLRDRRRGHRPGDADADPRGPRRAARRRARTRTRWS